MTTPPDPDADAEPDPESDAEPDPEPDAGPAPDLAAFLFPRKLESTDDFLILGRRAVAGWLYGLGDTLERAARGESLTAEQQATLAYIRILTTLESPAAIHDGVFGNSYRKILRAHLHIAGDVGGELQAEGNAWLNSVRVGRIGDRIARDVKLLGRAPLGDQASYVAPAKRALKRTFMRYRLRLGPIGPDGVDVIEPDYGHLSTGDVSFNPAIHGSTVDDHDKVDDEDSTPGLAGDGSDLDLGNDAAVDEEGVIDVEVDVELDEGPDAAAGRWRFADGDPGVPWWAVLAGGLTEVVSDPRFGRVDKRHRLVRLVIGVFVEVQEESPDEILARGGHQGRFRVYLGRAIQNADMFGAGKDDAVRKVVQNFRGDVKRVFERDDVGRALWLLLRGED